MLMHNDASISAVVWFDDGDQVYLFPHCLSSLVDHKSVFTGIKIQLHMKDKIINMK